MAKQKSSQLRAILKELGIKSIPELSNYVNLGYSFDGIFLELKIMIRNGTLRSLMKYNVTRSTLRVKNSHIGILHDKYSNVLRSVVRSSIIRIVDLADTTSNFSQHTRSYEDSLGRPRELKYWKAEENTNLREELLKILR